MAIRTLFSHLSFHRCWLERLLGYHPFPPKKWVNPICLTYVWRILSNFWTCCESQWFPFRKCVCLGDHILLSPYHIPIVFPVVYPHWMYIYNTIILCYCVWIHIPSYHRKLVVTRSLLIPLRIMISFISFINFWREVRILFCINFPWWPSQFGALVTLLATATGTGTGTVACAICAICAWAARAACSRLLSTSSNVCVSTWDLQGGNLREILPCHEGFRYFFP